MTIEQIYELARSVEPNQAMRMVQQVESDEERRFWAFVAEMNLQRRQMAVIHAERDEVSVDCRIAAARAEQLRQRAAILPDASDITRRLKTIEEAARQPRKSQEEPDKGKDLNGELNSLENEIEVRERRAKEERESDRALCNAVGDFANDLTKGTR